MKTGISVVRPEQASRQVTSLPVYTVYTLSTIQKSMCVILSGVLFAIIGYLFYHQWIISLLCAAGALAMPRYFRQFLLQRRRSVLSIQFKQALYSLSSSLSAGRSVENAFREAVEDLRLLSPDGDHDLIFEFGIITACLEIGQPVEDALQDLARRAQIEDITNFSDVFAACKRTGGDLVEVVRRASNVIGEKLEIQQEISVMIAQKRFESRVMFAAPFLFVLFMTMTAGDYMMPLYSGTGMILSTFCLLVLGGCLVWINSIMKIEV
ncbi:type II secretion system F family protein [Paenibacillus farraposensis]|uniref:Type II secretion system F family protein n=1 Tax=Paenibacillus farraposensis TaxID=2807095 RepID=A0ABW4DBD6_9BACL|nr:type II secretion system F family protein [Paenibacillus farraposensis]MCC3381870.1 type II secretion system F family protein [Paenibacillus farraposensis]